MSHFRHATLLIVLCLAIVALLPNLIWLPTSTLRIANETDKDIHGVRYRACETEFPLGTIASGQSAFYWLPACGDDTLTIILDEREFCQIYVEGELYHVDTEIDSPTQVTCEYDDPVSSLFVAKMF